MACRPKRKSNIPLSVVRRSSGTTTKRLRVEQVRVPLPVHGDESDPGTATEIVDESGNACNVDIPEMEDCFAVDSENTKTSHTRRKQRAADKWEELRCILTRTVVEKQCLPPHGVPCYICGKDDVAVRCTECGPFHFYCEHCATELHVKCFYHHCPEIWKDDQFMPMLLPVPILPELGHSCNCGSRRTITCFHIEGVPRTLSVMFCPCESDVVKLIKLNYWPATPTRPSIAFSFSLLDWLEALLLECQVALHDATEAIAFLIKEKMECMPCKLYPVLIDAFEEYRYMKGQIRSLECVSSVFRKGAVCPACPKDGGIITISLDALFGLCRKKAAGSSVHGPLNAGTVFDDQSQVNTFIDNYRPKKDATEKECSSFLAGDALRSRTRFKALDETGVMGTICRHETPISFFNLHHGERIGYAVFMLEKLHQHFPNHSIQLMYDIACSLEKHLKANSRSDLTDCFELAIPIFHAYGHKMECQIALSPRNIEGFGLSDSEGTERLWSYLRRFSTMTKEMRPSHRIDVLTDAILFYAQKSSSNLGRLLVKRMNHACEVQRKSNEALEKLMNASSVRFSRTDVEKWMQEEKSQSTSDTQPIEPGPGWQEQYVLHIDSYNKLRTSLDECDEDASHSGAIAVQLQLVERKLKTFEQKHNLLHRWAPSSSEYQVVKSTMEIRRKSKLRDKIQHLARERWFLLSTKAKYADGHVLASRLSKRITTVSKQLRKLISTYNEDEPENGQVTWQSANDLSLDQQLGQSQLAGASDLPREVKHQAVRQLQLVKRSSEEITRLKKEMTNCLHYYVDELQQLQAVRSELQVSAASMLKLGSVCLINRHIFRCQRRLNELTSKFTSFVEVPLPICTLPDSVSLSSSNQIQGDKEIPCLSQTGEEEYNVEEEISIREPDAAEKYVDSNVYITDDESSSEETDLIDIEVQEMQHSQPESSLMRAEDDDDGSDNELLETQTWRVQRLERNEFLDTLKSQQDDSLLCEQDQQVLSMIHDSSERTQSTNSAQGYLHRPREYLQRMLSIANKDAARARVVARGPMFPPK